MKQKIYSHIERIIAIAIFHDYIFNHNMLTSAIYGQVTIKGIKNGILKYDKSWDWLMPVIEKIEDFGYLFENTRFPDYDSDAYKYFAQFRKIDAEKREGLVDKNGLPVYMFDNMAGDKIDAAFLSVSDFCIEWCIQSKKTFEIINHEAAN